MNPYDQNHPRLAYLQPRTVAEPPTLIAVMGQDKAAVPLSNQMLWQLLEQITVELRKVYASPHPPSV